MVSDDQRVYIKDSLCATTCCREGGMGQPESDNQWKLLLVLFQKLHWVCGTQHLRRDGDQLLDL